MIERRNLKSDIIALLLANPDGMTVSQISKELGAFPENVRTTLTKHRPYGVYISRYERNGRGHPSAYYKAVECPDDAPKLRGRSTPEERKALNRLYVNHHYAKKRLADAERRANIEEAARQRRILTGIQTTIRGPWPTSGVVQ